MFKLPVQLAQPSLTSTSCTAVEPLPASLCCCCSVSGILRCVLALNRVGLLFLNPVAQMIHCTCSSRSGTLKWLRARLSLHAGRHHRLISFSVTFKQGESVFIIPARVVFCCLQSIKMWQLYNIRQLNRRLHLTKNMQIIFSVWRDHDRWQWRKKFLFDLTLLHLLIIS